MLLLKRLNVPLDRDVIFVSEAGEEGSIRRRHRLHGQGAVPADRRRVLPGRRRRRRPHRRRGEVRDGADAGEDPARHRAGGARHLGPWLGAAQVERDRPPAGCGGEGRRVAPPKSASTRPPAATSASSRAISPPEVAKVYRDVLSTDPKVQKAADDWLLENEPRHSSMLRTSVSPNIFNGGYRSNVIPSEAKATLDVRALPDEDPAKFLEQVKQIVNDPGVEVRFTGANERPAAADAAARLRGRSRRSKPPVTASTTPSPCRR